MMQNQFKWSQLAALVLSPFESLQLNLFMTPESILIHVHMISAMFSNTLFDTLPTNYIGSFMRQSLPDMTETPL